jgi:hypothetical protein
LIGFDLRFDLPKETAEWRAFVGMLPVGSDLQRADRPGKMIVLGRNPLLS